MIKFSPYIVINASNAINNIWTRSAIAPYNSYDVSFYFAVGDRIKFNFVRYIVEKVAQNLVDQVWLLI